MNKVFVIGLDGSTFDIINPFVEKGLLPNIKYLIENGIKSKLISTVPPLTAPAWLALSTGLNPGKTGIYDFLKRKDSKTNELTTVSSADFKGKAIWDILSSSDKKVIIINYPMLFPPYEINGYMISGIGTSWQEDITYPKTLKKEISNWTKGKYKVLIKPMDYKYKNEDLFINDLYNMLEQRVKVVKKLMDREWDLFFTVFVATDRIQHLIWKYLDESHPLYQEDKAKKYKPIFEKFYTNIDNIIGELIKELPQNTNLLIISDHGFGPVTQCFNLPKWLIMRNYMKFKDSKVRGFKIPKNLRVKLMKLRYSMIRKAIPDKIFKFLYEKIISRSAGKIDFENSTAFTLPHSDVMGMIYILDQTIKINLIDDIKNIGRDIGKIAKPSIFLKEELYNGNKLRDLPDILFTIDDWKTYFKHTGLNDTLYDSVPYSPRLSGTHRRDGIFIGFGPNFKKGLKLEEIEIYDIAPTILYLMDEKIPQNVDGKVLREAISGIDRAPEFFKVADYGLKEEEFDEEKVKERLKDLGYFG